MIGVNDSIDAFLALCIEREACPEAIEYIARGRDNGWTIRQLIAAVKDHDANEGGGWCVWARMTVFDQLTDSAKRLFTDMATRDEPRMAAHFDIYLADIMPTEQAIVQSRWTAEELPNIARQLADGTVTRQRD